MELSSIKRKLLLLISKYYTIIVIVLVLFILAAGYWVFVKDKVVEIQEVGLVDLQSTLNALDNKETVLIKMEKLNEQYSQITEDQIRQLSLVLPHQSEIPYLVIEVKEFIKDNDLLLNSIDVGPLSSNDATAESTGGTYSINELKITLSFSGVESYFKLKDFLDNLSNQLPLFELTSLVYSHETDAYALNLTTYYQ